VLTVRRDENAPDFLEPVEKPEEAGLDPVQPVRRCTGETVDNPQIAMRVSGLVLRRKEFAAEIMATGLAIEGEGIAFAQQQGPGILDDALFSGIARCTLETVDIVPGRPQFRPDVAALIHSNSEIRDAVNVGVVFPACREERRQYRKACDTH
jgi:hypothetical protein